MAKKKTEPIETEPIKLNLIGNVVIVGTANSKYLIEGKEYTVTGKLAETLINKGSAKLKQ